MNAVDFIIDNIIIIIGMIILAVLYWRISANKTIAQIEIEKLRLYFHMGCIALLVIFVQQKFFPEHYYLLIGLPVFIPFWFFFIRWLLSRDDVYILESTIQGETFYDLKNLKKVVADNTSQRLLIMPREIYDSKQHVGDLHYSLWAGSPRIKFCDKYDDETGIFYHPALQQLHNYTFYGIKSLWLKLKTDLPHIIDQNTILTLMKDWELAFKMDVIKENLDVHLKALNYQHSAIPFTMPDNLEQLFKKAIADKARDIAMTEKQTTNKEIETKAKETAVATADTGTGE